MYTQPTSNDDIIYALLRALRPSGDIAEDQLLNQLRRDGVPHPAAVVDTCLELGVLQPAYASRASETCYHLDMNAAPSVAAPPFYHALKTRNLNRREALIPFLDLPEPERSNGTHPLAEAQLTYRKAGTVKTEKGDPGKFITLKQLHAQLVHSTPRLRAMSAAVAAAADMHCYAQYTDCLDRVMVGGTFKETWKGWQLEQASGMGVLHLLLDTEFGRWSDSWHALLSDPRLHDALLLLTTWPCGRGMTAVLELSPTCRSYAEGVREYWEYFLDRQFPGLSCLTTGQEQITRFSYVGHDPYAYLHPELR